MIQRRHFSCNTNQLISLDFICHYLPTFFLLNLIFFLSQVRGRKVGRAVLKPALLHPCDREGNVYSYYL
nr:MAG TPA: hypothetical protein [Caudoviricetes sp.]